MQTKYLLAAAIAAVLSFPVLASNSKDALLKTPPAEIYQSVSGTTLAEALKKVAARSGITFKIHTDISKDVLLKTVAADNWDAAVTALLEGYNFAVIKEAGKITEVMVIGRGSMGQVPPPVLEPKTLITVAPVNQILPVKYAQYPAGSVLTIDLPINELMQIQEHADVVLDLPMGKMQVTHDKSVAETDGSTTWVGFLKNEGPGYHVFVSQGESGVMGHVTTPDGTYNIESDNTGTYLVDTSKLTHAGFNNDTVLANNELMQAVTAKATSTPTVTTATSAKADPVDLTTLAQAVTDTQNALNAATAAVTTKQSAVTSAQAALNTATTTASVKQTAVTSAQSILNTASAAFATKTTALPAVKSALTSLNAAITTDNTNLTNATAAYTAALPAVTTAQEALSSATKTLNTAKSAIAAQTPIKAAADKAYSEAQAAVKTAQSNATTANTALSIAIAAYNKSPTAANLAAKNAAQTAVTNAASASLTASTKLTQASTAATTENSKYSTLNLALINATSTFNNANNALNNANTTLISKLSTLNSAKAKLVADTAALAKANAAVLAAQTELTTAQTALTTAQSALTATQATLSSAQTALIAAKSALTDAQTALTNAQATLKTAQAAYKAAKAAYDAATGTANGTEIDIMVLYTTASQSAAFAKQRLSYLVTASNQAYQDSGVNMSIRLVYAEPTSYAENNSNSSALYDLASDKGAFAGTAAKRAKYGADLVYLFRPLYANVAGSCGTTYVEFANGSTPDASIGFGTISDGTGKDNPTYYCNINTFTHEIGHSFGLVHDVEYSSFPGVFPDAYAWGVTGKFATIMSYKSPVVMLFANPALTSQCAGQACGTSTTNQVKALQYTAPIVAGFLPKITTTPVIN